MRTLTRTLGLALCCASFSLWATERKLMVHSKFDRYELILHGNGSGTVNGKPATLDSFKDLLPMLTDPLTSDCPALKPPADATVVESGKTRYIYLKEGIVSDGKQCLSVSGEGLYFFPVHRDFLIGPKHDGVKLKSPIKVFRQGTKILELHQENGKWITDNANVLLNWDFIERFENSLSSFDIRFRALPELGQDKPKMILQSGDQSYEFFKVGNLTWAMKKPGGHWLEASDTWSFWYDFDKDVLEDRYAAQIREIQDRTQPAQTRLADLQKVEGTWSRNLRELYQNLVLAKDEPTQIKKISFDRLKRKPSLETAGVMAEYLQKGDDEEFKHTASQILKIQDPKGPLYKPQSSATEKSQAVEYWSRWWAKHKSSR